jgi:hypothetical protein
MEPLTNEPGWAPGRTQYVVSGSTQPARIEGGEEQISPPPQVAASFGLGLTGARKGVAFAQLIMAISKRPVRAGSARASVHQELDKSDNIEGDLV